MVEDPVLDAQISGREYGQADFLHTFRPQSDNKLVWLPVQLAMQTTRPTRIRWPSTAATPGLGLLPDAQSRSFDPGMFI